MSPSGGTLTVNDAVVTDRTADANTCGGDDDLYGWNPLLGPLQNNGGFTPTHAPQPGSWAIDNGENNAYVCANTDQRGLRRPIAYNIPGVAVCDIGAIEVGLSVYLPSILR